MLLTIRFIGGGHMAEALLGGEVERHEECLFGQGIAWTVRAVGSSTVYFSLAVDVARVVEKTKRRDREERFSVGYCDSYPYAASGLMALFLSRLRLRAPVDGAQAIEIEMLAYPERPHADEIARRLFSPVGYAVQIAGGRLQLRGERPLGQALAELPILLLALDRRTRLFLREDELAEIAGAKANWIVSHPARRAIELALAGRATPLRQLLPAGAFGSAIRLEEEKLDTSLLKEGAQISTALVPSISIADSQRMFALRAFSRMNIDPRWLIYLPAAICSLQEGPGELERPENALNYFRGERIGKVVIEEKHMGSRGIVVLCRSHQVAQDRFGVSGEAPGCAYTRNGRRFFKNEDTEAVFLERLGAVLSGANFWTRFETEWVCFDGEILPWSVKAAESSEESDLVEAGSLVLGETATMLGDNPKSSLQVYWKGLIDRERVALSQYDRMFKRYRSECADLAALKFAPFHLLAVEGRTFFHQSHLWHMQTVAKLARTGEGFVVPTRYELVDTTQPNTWEKALRWWDELSEKNSEGFVVKPLPFVPRGRRGLAQPALKCRSHEHLRLVYGPQYDSREALELLLARDALKRRRNKHRRILRQFALSIEAVTRFVQRDSLNAVHECILGILAQEVPRIMSH